MNFKHDVEYACERAPHPQRPQHPPVDHSQPQEEGQDPQHDIREPPPILHEEQANQAHEDGGHRDPQLHAVQTVKQWR